MPFENQQNQQSESIIDKLKKIVGWPESTSVSNNSAETNNPPNDLSTFSSLAREIFGKIKAILSIKYSFLYTKSFINHNFLLKNIFLFIRKI